MRRLQQLLQARIVYVEDVLYFTFKKHVFTGCVIHGGLIWKVTWQKPGEEPKNIFSNAAKISEQPYIRTFESLTDWTETCIQECLDEYHTRYSSWKRVRHKRTEQPMEVLFKHLQKRQITRESEQSKQILLYEQLAGHRNYIDSLKQTIHEWETWFGTTHKGLQNPVTTPVEPCEELEEQAQPFVLTSDSGKYMVLHRVNEVAPQECISWLKENGQNSFEKILQSIHFEPATHGQDSFAPVDNETSKRFVHNFFND